jgi:hypothetical protein
VNALISSPVVASHALTCMSSAMLMIRVPSGVASTRRIQRS